LDFEVMLARKKTCKIHFGVFYAAMHILNSRIENLFQLSRSLS